MTQDHRLYDAPDVSATYFFPQPHRPLPGAQDAGPLSLHLPNGTRIGCYWSRPLAHALTILYLHGNGECIADQLDHWPDWARQAGANIFFVDYPGYASSPVLLLHTRHDSLVPSWNSQRLAGWAGSKLQRLVLFEQGDHNDIQWTNSAAYLAALTEFIGVLQCGKRN